MKNPTVEELTNNNDFELIFRLDHQEIKEFVIRQLAENGKVVRFFMIYQVAMILFGLFFLTRSMVLVFKGNFQPLFYTGAALIFSFSFLVAIHELLHGIALKLTGAKKVTFGGYLRKFIFYAEADRHVLNRSQFAFVALTPLIVVKAVTLAGILFFVTQPAFYFFVLVMSAHSLFCAGDIGLLSLFYQIQGTEVYTFDVKEEKRSYYYKREI